MAIKTAGTVQSVDEIVNLTTEPKIAKLQKSAGERATYGIVKMLLMQMNANLHIDNGLTEDNITSMARYLTSDPELKWWLTLADIDLLCRQIVRGKFGKFFGHFSELEFNECLIKYCNERSDCHRQQNDKAVTTPAQAALTMKELGYSISKDGRLQVPDEKKESRLAQPLYLYNDKGKRVGINPKGYFGHKASADSIYNLAKGYMSADPSLTLDQAIDKAEETIKQSQNQ